MKKRRRQSAQDAHVTMQDVARASGVSPMTVSRVMSGIQTVDAKMRKRVLTAARRLDYVPNALASNLARNRSGFIGVATPFRRLLGTAFFGRMMIGFQAALQSRGYDFALFDCASDAFGSPEELAKIYRQKRAEGILILSPRMDDQYLKTLGGMGIPFVVVGEYMAGRSVPSVSCNDEQGIELAVAHLLELGHERIAYVGGPPKLGSTKRRESAFLGAMHGVGIRVPAHFVQPADYAIDGGRAAARRLLKGRSQPTAVVTANDVSALGFVWEARAMGLRVPADVSVTGFDDLLHEGEVGPCLTTIHQPLEEIAVMGARRLLDALERGESARGHVDVDVSLVVRESTGRLGKSAA